MAKPIQDQIFRSRVKITYRTTIDGVPVEEKLPLRILVLGNFSGRPPPDPRRPAKASEHLEKRLIRSITRGMKVDSLMDEMGLSLPLPRLPEGIRPHRPSELTLPIRGTLRGAVREGEGGRRYLVLADTLEVKSARADNGIGDIAARIEVTAQREIDAADPGPEEELDCVLHLEGRLSGDFAARLDHDYNAKIRSIEIQGESASAEYEVEARAARRLPVRGLRWFSPDAVAQNTEEVRRLLVVKALLADLRFKLTSSFELRDALREKLKALEAAPPGALARVQGGLRARYPQLMIGAPPPAAASPEPGPEDAGLIDDAMRSVEPVLGQVAKILGLEDRFETHRGAMPVALVEAPEPRGAPATTLAFYDRDTRRDDWERFLNSALAFVVNADLEALQPARLGPTELMGSIDAMAVRIEDRVRGHVGAALRDPDLREMEAAWRGLADLVKEVQSEEVIIDVLDVTREELRVDFEDHDTDIFQSALFKKVYLEEYDRYGGKPFGAMIGLYEFDDPVGDIPWLQTVAKIANASHCPFVAAVAPGFFGCHSAEELEALPNLDAVMQHPRYSAWEQLRESDGAAYLGLVVPRYLLRRPWGAELDEGRVDARNNSIQFREEIARGEEHLWGNAAILMARNMVRSFEDSGWCQHIRGPRGGGLVRGLVVHEVRRHDREELQPPVDVAIADFRELQFANNGFIPLIHRKGTGEATFFSARSVKKALLFQSEIDTQNADLVCNLAYTMSITRIAHYVKRIARDYVGSTADATYLQQVLNNWLKRYITTVTNPDDLTLLHYPFKAATVSVEPRPGPLGWYRCVISILPHIQFEGMDVELRLEARLGGK